MQFGQLELFSYTAVLLGKRQLLLSLVGFLLILACSRLWRRQASASLLAPWLFFLSWLVWAPLVFTPELLQGIQAPLRETWSTIAPADVFTLCSQSVVHRFRTGPLGGIPLFSWNLMILAGWSLFACWRIVHLRLRRQRFVAIANAALPLADAQHVVVVDRWRQALRIRRSVELRTSETCGQAFTVGLLRPVIHLPGVFLRELSIEELDAVIGHEMAHVKRCDDLVIRVQRLLRALFFFNPAIGLASRRVAELREQCCDRLAIERGRLSPKHYGASLLRTLSLGRLHGNKRNGWYRDQPGDAVVGLHSSPLRRRIESLTRGNRGFSPAPLVGTALMLTSLSLLFGHTGSTPMTAPESGRLLAGLGAASPVPGQGVSSKPFIWPDKCVIGSIDPSVYHPGVDFAAPAGRTTAIHAIAAGTVTHVVKRRQLPGWQVHVSHVSGLVSTYLHLDTPLVSPGDQVDRGQAIATSEGRDHQHVHVEVHHQGRVLDPSYLLTLNH